MDPRKLRLGFLVATAAIALAFLSPIAAESAPLFSRSVTSSLCIAAGLLFLLAAALNDQRATISGFAGALAAAGASLLLLRDPTIAGSARIGFWMLVLACWLAAALCVVNLAAVHSLRRERQRVFDVLVPLMFGATCSTSGKSVFAVSAYRLCSCPHPAPPQRALQAHSPSWPATSPKPSSVASSSAM